MEWLEEAITVYNFEVADYHTYYVGDEDVLVHNKCANPSGSNGNTNTRHIKLIQNIIQLQERFILAELVGQEPHSKM